MDLPPHADLLFLDECRRGFLRQAGPEPATARRLRFHRGSQEVDSGLHRAAQRKGGGAIQMDGRRVYLMFLG